MFIIMLMAGNASHVIITYCIEIMFWELGKTCVHTGNCISNISKIKLANAIE